MADKTNKTQEDMVENTFGGFDDDIQTQTSDHQSVEPDGSAGGEPAKKTSSNKMIYGVGAAAAVLVVGYMFVKPMLMGGSQPPATPAPVVSTSPVTPTPTAAPVMASQPVVPVAPVQPASAPVADQNFLNQNGPNPLAGNRSVPDAASASAGLTSPTPISPVTPVVPGVASQGAVSPVSPIAPVTPVTPMNQVSPVLPASTPDVAASAGNAGNIQPVTPITPVAPASSTTVATPVIDTNVSPVPVNGAVGNNTTQQALVDQLKSMFEQQTRDIKVSIDAVGDRVTTVEKAISDQKDVNKSIEERLTKLESGQTTKSIVSKPRAEKADKADTTEAAKPEVRHTHHVAPVRKSVVRKVQKDQNQNDSDVLVDKSVAQTSVSSVAPVAPANIQIHSVFAGRVWIKNSDSSLATYVAGERLPTGEIIKRIDDEHGTIITDKRVIK